jgi:hypothetical protein
MTIAMTDKQWSSAIKNTKPPLPEAARPEVEQAINMAVARRETFSDKPSLAEGDLITVAKAADKLATLIDRLGAKERIALSEYFIAGKKPAKEVAAIARVFAGVCRGACGDIPRVRKTDLADIMVDDLDRIVRKYTGVAVTWRKGSRGFLEETGGIAGFSPSSLRNAVKRLVQSRKQTSPKLASVISSELDMSSLT